MVHQALRMIQEALRRFLRPASASLPQQRVLICPAAAHGNIPLPGNCLSISLLGLEPEIHAFRPTPASIKSPPLDMNILVLIVANFSDYEESLKFLHRALCCFQAKSSLTAAEFPNLPFAAARLNIEPHFLTLDQQNHLWSSLHRPLLPFMVYRLRLIRIQNQNVKDTLAAPVSDMRPDLKQES